MCASDALSTMYVLKVGRCTQQEQRLPGVLPVHLGNICSPRALCERRNLGDAGASPIHPAVQSSLQNLKAEQTGVMNSNSRREILVQTSAKMEAPCRDTHFYQLE